MKQFKISEVTRVHYCLLIKILLNFYIDTMVYDKLIFILRAWVRCTQELVLTHYEVIYQMPCGCPRP